MPGLITHKKILEDAISLISSPKRKKTYIDKSIISLMSSPEYRRAALFGSIGPNIFDYLPSRDKNNYVGHPVSYFFHNGNSEKLISSFTSILFSYKDKQTHWASMQRAYLFGFISHIIADTIIHPFSFYWSGFPKAVTKKDVIYYRHQNLLYYYNMDNYFLYKDDNKDSLFFNSDEMIPIEKARIFKRISPAIRCYILKAIDDSQPDMFNKLLFKKTKVKDKNNDYYLSLLSYLDLFPDLFFLTQKLKKTPNEKIHKVLDKLASNTMTYSDFFVRYPHHRNINDHVLNLHMEKWQFPAGSPELKYESIKKLINTVLEKTLVTWRDFEESLFNETEIDFSSYFNFNALTGTESSYHDMKLSEPIKLMNF